MNAVLLALVQLTERKFALPKKKAGCPATYPIPFASAGTELLSVRITSTSLRGALNS
jgi:hypothetical protein